MKVEECEIVEIIEIECNDDFVYNLEIEDNHNYFAEDILVSNCHCFRADAASVLLKTLEEPPASSIFILATTNPQKIIPTIKSRCQRFELKRLKIQQIVEKMTSICNTEGINIGNPNALNLIARASHGSMRDALSFLDAVSGRCGKKINEDEVLEILGLSSQTGIFEVFNNICLNDISKSILETKKLIAGGVEPLEVFNSLLDMVHDMLLAQSLKTDAFMYIDDRIRARWDKICGNINPIILSSMICKISEYIAKIEYVPRIDSLLDSCVVDLIAIIRGK